jgi:hypothetical protein
MRRFASRRGLKTVYYSFRIDEPRDVQTGDVFAGTLR